MVGSKAREFASLLAVVTVAGAVVLGGTSMAHVVRRLGARLSHRHW
jgi:hypothetical protein